VSQITIQAGEIRSTREKSPSPRAARGEILGIAALVAIAVGAPVLAAQLSGGFDIPRNDDWIYARIAENWHATGDLEVSGWTPFALVGHLVWGLLFLGVFGVSIATFHWAGAVAGALGLVGAFVALRQVAPARAALFGTAVVAACPCYALLAPTYMTDLSAFAAQAWCLALGLRALPERGRRQDALLAASLLIGAFGFTIREQAIAAPLAVLAAHAVAERRAGTPHRRTAVGAAMLLSGLTAFYLWRRGLPGGSGYEVHRPTRHAVGDIGQAAFTLGLFALPLAAAAARRPRIHDLGRAAAGAGAAAAAVGVAVLAIAAVRGRSPDLLVGNLLTRTGPLDARVLTGSRPALFPGWSWWVLSGAAVASAAALAAAATSAALAARRAIRTERLRALEPRTVLGWGFLALAATAVFGGALVRGVFDRYLLPVVFGLALVAALRYREALAWSRAGAGALVLLGVLGAASVAAGNAFDVARWRAGEAAVAQGVAAGAVDAGYEWVGRHYPGALATDERSRARPPAQWYMRDVFPRARNCATVAASPQRTAGLRASGVRSYRVLPWGRRHRLVIYRRACP
jgi:hypothetical protein